MHICVSAHMYAYTRTHKIDSSEKMGWDSVSALKGTLAEWLLGSTSLHVAETQLQTDQGQRQKAKGKGGCPSPTHRLSLHDISSLLTSPTIFTFAPYNLFSSNNQDVLPKMQISSCPPPPKTLNGFTFFSR